MLRSSQRNLLLLLATSSVLSLGLNAVEDRYERPPVRYSSTQPEGPIARLQDNMNAGRVELDRSGEKELLRDLLGQLKIPEASQVLVFSKTSHQNERISPATPRALYFNDEVYLGWAQGGVVEAAAITPNLGPVFYVLDPRRSGEHIEFDRTASCLSCHAGSRVNNMPGLMVRSVYPDGRGFPILSEGTFLTGHHSPLEERWGGWYVTGRHGGARHMGNAVAREADGRVRLDRESGANQTSLEEFFDTEPYLRGTSDIVALMVLEHQVEMHNILSQAGCLTRIALHQRDSLNRELGLAPTDVLEGSARTVVESQSRRILKHLFFQDEAALPEGGVDGDFSFQEAFQRNARRNREGRSLKDFQLLDRLFKYRCSYVIYTEAFDGLPVELKHEVYSGMARILSEEDGVEGFEHLSRSERTRIREILADTKPEIRAYLE